MKWNIDERHSHAGFTVKHLGLTNVRGEFEKKKSSIVTDEKGDIVSGEITMDATSINTRDKERDTHLQTGDFFNATKYPTISFRSTAVSKIATDEYEITGNLTMLGITKSTKLHVIVTPPTKSPFGDTRLAVELTGEINRTEWGMRFNQFLDNGGLLVGEKVKIYLDAEYIAE